MGSFVLWSSGFDLFFLFFVGFQSICDPASCEEAVSRGDGLFNLFLLRRCCKLGFVEEILQVHLWSIALWYSWSDTRSNAVSYGDDSLFLFFFFCWFLINLRSCKLRRCCNLRRWWAPFFLIAEEMLQVGFLLRRCCKSICNSLLCDPLSLEIPLYLIYLSWFNLDSYIFN